MPKLYSPDQQCTERHAQLFLETRLKILTRNRRTPTTAQSFVHTLQYAATSVFFLKKRMNIGVNRWHYLYFLALNYRSYV